MNNNCIPFLRWPGGKRWLTEHLSNVINFNDINKYYEPFLGGGAVYFKFVPQLSELSDVNSELINVYKNVQLNCEKLIEILKIMPLDRQAYYKIRDHEPDDNIERAARFLYLNRLGFAGMYRVNRHGKFNVPYGGGRKVDILWKNELLKNASNALKGATINCCDFECTVNKANKNDLVYCDPTYISNTTTSFTRYNDKTFSWEDQKRLANSAIRAVNRGATVIISNVADNDIAELYLPIKPIVVARHSCLSRTLSGRKIINEYIFVLSGNM